MIKCNVVAVFRGFLHVRVSHVCDRTILKCQCVGMPRCTGIHPRDWSAIVTIMIIGQIPEIGICDIAAEVLACRLYCPAAITDVLVIDDTTIHV